MELEFLDISSTNIATLPRAFKKFKNLKVLRMSGQNITKIPNVIFNLKKLRTLVIANSSITEIPNSIKKLKNLKELILWSNNSLQYVSKNLSKLRLDVLAVCIENSSKNLIGFLKKIQVVEFVNCCM